MKLSKRREYVFIALCISFLNLLAASCSEMFRSSLFTRYCKSSSSFNSGMPADSIIKNMLMS